MILLFRNRTCTACGDLKTVASFYPSVARCKDCHRAAVRARREANLDRARAYDRERSRAPERLRHLTDNTRRFRRENPEKLAAHNAVARALRAGKLVRRPCESCGTTARVHAHHDDYARPLDVRWLCPVHHAARHAELRIINDKRRGA